MTPKIKKICWLSEIYCQYNSRLATRSVQKRQICKSICAGEYSTTFFLLCKHPEEENAIIMKEYWDEDEEDYVNRVMC